MSRTFVSPGNTIDAIAPVGGVKSGAVIAYGKFVGVAEVDAKAGDSYALTLEGVHRLPKATGALAAGAFAYWDNAAGKVTGTTTGNTLLGAVVEGADSAATEVLVRLNGIAA